MRVDPGVDEQDLVRAPARAKAFEPRADAVGQRDANHGQKLFRADRLHFESHELPHGGCAAVAQPVRQRAERGVPRGAHVEREPHHRLVVAHEADLLIRPDQGPRPGREVDRAEAVRTAVDQVAEEDQRPPVPTARLERGFVDQGAQQIGPAVNVADGEHFDVRGDGPRHDKGLSLDDGRHDVPYPARVQHCMPRAGRASIVSCS